MADLKIKIGVDTSEIDSLTSTIQSKLKSINMPDSLNKSLERAKTIKLDANIQSALNQLNSLNKNIKALNTTIKIDIDDKSIKNVQNKISDNLKNGKRNQSSNSDLDRYWKDANRYVKEYQKTKSKLNEYSAKSDAGIATPRQIAQMGELKTKADSLKSTLLNIGKIKPNNEFFDKSKLSAFNKAIIDVNRELKTEKQLKIDTSQAEADIKKLNKLEKEYIKSSKREAKAYSKLKPDGGNANEIREMISQEQKLQSELKETAKLAGLGDEFSKRASKHRAATEEMKRNEDRLRKAREKDAEMNRIDPFVQKSVDAANRRGVSAQRGIKGFAGVMPTINVMDVWREGSRAIRSVYEEVHGVEDALISVRKVVDATDKQWDSFTKTLHKNASASGVVVEDYARSVGKWAQAGKSLDEAKYLGQLSNIGAFIGELDENKVIDYMSVPLNAWKKEQLEAHQILNVMNEVANNNAVEMDHLGVAYTKAAATAANAGTSFTELTSLIGAAQESTRLGGQVVGTSLRQMDINLAKIANRGTKGFQKKFDRLKEVGVNVVDANNELRSTFDILQDLSNVWGTLDKNQQSALSFDIAGARGNAVLTGIMNNWEKVKKMKDEAEGQLGFSKGTGSAFDEFAIQQDSITYKMNALKNSWNEFIHTVTGGPGPFKQAIEQADQLIQKLNGWAKNEDNMKLASNIAKVFGGHMVAKAARTPFDMFAKSFEEGGQGMARRFASTYDDATGKFIPKAEKDVKGFNKLMVGVGKTTSKIGRGFSKLANGIGYVGLAIDAFNIADTISESLFGFDLSQWAGDLAKQGARAVKGFFDPVGQAIDDYRRKNKELLSSLSSNKLLSGELTQANNVVKKYQELASEKQRAFNVSGDYGQLTWNESEFEEMSQSFNNMIDELGLEQDLKITWNDYDHIMGKLEEAKTAIEQLSVSSAKDAANAISELYANEAKAPDNGYFRDWAKRNKVSPLDTSLKYVKDMYEAQLTNLPEDKSTWGSAEWAKAHMMYVDSVGRYYGAYRQFMDSSYSASLVSGKQDEIDQLNKHYSSLLGNLNEISGKNIGDSLTDIFRNQRGKEGMDRVFAKAIVEASKYKVAAEEAGKAQQLLSDYYSKFGVGNKSEDAIKQVEKYQKAIEQVVDTLDKEDVDALNKITGGKSVQELNKGQILELMEFLGNLKATAKEVSDSVRDSIDRIAKDNGWDAKKAARLYDAATEGATAYAKALMDMDKVVAEQELLGANAAIIKPHFDEVGLNWEDVYLGAQQELENKVISADMAVELNLTNKDGMLTGEGMKKMLDLEMLNKQYNINVGFNLDGKNDVQEFMNFLQVGKEQQEQITKLKLGIEFDENGLMDFDSYKAAIAKLEEDGLTEQERDILIKLKQILESDTTDYDDKVNSIKQEASKEEKVTKPVSITPEYSLDKNEADNLMKGFAEQLKGKETFDYEAYANIFLESGEINLDAIYDNIKLSQGQIADIEDVLVKAGVAIEPNGEVDRSELVAYLSELNNTEGTDGVIDFLVKVLPKLQADEVDKSNLDESIELEDGEATQQINVAKNYVEDEESASEPPEVPETLETQQSILPIDVTYDYNVSSSGIEGIREFLELNRGAFNIQGSVNLNNSEHVLQVMEQIQENANTRPQMEVIATQYGFDSVESMMSQLRTQAQQDYQVNITSTGDTTGIDNVNSAIEQMPESANVAINMQANGASDVESAVNTVQAADNTNAIMTLEVQVNNIDEGLSNIRRQIESLNTMESVSVSISANTESANSAISTLTTSLNTLTSSVNECVITGNNTDAINKINEVINLTIPQKTVTVVANTSAAIASINAISGKTVTVNVRTSRRSMSIGTQIGASMSRSIGSALTNASSIIRKSTGINRSTSTKDEKRVNEDVWRYWAKELYQGNPLSNNIDALKDEIKGLKGNFDELISTYNKQIKATQQQIEYEKEMAELEQQQLNDIIAKLKGLGFTASGNKITNLSHAKSLTGDNASEADSLLRDWKSLYSSISSLNTRISSLQSDIKDTQEDIRKAREDKEAKYLEKRLNSIESVMKVIGANTSIASKKADLMDEYDYNLRLSVDEESMNTSIKGIQGLLNQFNSLAKTTYEFESNAEDAYSKLEDLKSSILDNADAIIEYRDSMNQIPIDMLINDMDRFSNVVSQNTNTLSRNVERLKEGLISGSGTSELSDFAFIDLRQNNKIKRSYEERLKLEAELDKVLETFSKRQVERVGNVANAMLDIERNKYNQLLKMSRDYTNGQVVMADSINVGLSGTDGYSAKIRMTEQLINSMSEYQLKYEQSISKYSELLNKASTSTEREIINKNMLLNQLKLQEEYQYNIIDQYKNAIKASQALLANEELNTSQRNELLESINSYKEEMANAQDAIRDAIKTRFEYEFDLMDKASEQAQRQYDALNHLLEMGSLTNLSSEAMSPLFKSVYEASLNQYNLAKKQLAELNREQAKFQKGSLEWNLIADKIAEITEKVQDFSIQSLNANKDILNNSLSSLNKFYDKSLLNGKTLDDWKSFYDNFVDGVEKELKVEALRVKTLGLEDETIKKRLEAIDRQDKVSKKELEYLEKQMKLSELQEKLRNLEKERNVQVLTRRDDGTWAFDYVANQGEIDKVESDINDSKLELEEFKREQRASYVSGLGDIIEKAKEGKYENPEDLQKDLNTLNATYGSVLADIPDLKNLSFDELLSVYSQYMQKNGIIAKDFMRIGNVETKQLDVNNKASGLLSSIDATKNTLGDLLSNSMKTALGIPEGHSIVGSQVIYNIANVELPNVTDGIGFANFFNDLPKVAEQQTVKK